jgi:hypothetical protein
VRPEAFSVDPRRLGVFSQRLHVAVRVSVGVGAAHQAVRNWIVKNRSRSMPSAGWRLNSMVKTGSPSVGAA